MDLGSLPELVVHSVRVAHRALDLGENRLELVMVEAQESCERLLQAMLLALGAAVLGLLSGVAIVALVTVGFWNSSPLLPLTGLFFLYGGGALFLYLRLVRLVQEWQVFSSTLEQLRKDRECLAGCLG